MQADLVSCQPSFHQVELAAHKPALRQQELDCQTRAADVAQQDLDVKVRETEARLAAREAALLKRRGSTAAAASKSAEGGRGAFHWVKPVATGLSAGTCQDTMINSA